MTISPIAVAAPPAASHPPYADTSRPYPVRYALLGWGPLPDSAENGWVVLYIGADELCAREEARRWLDECPESQVQLLEAMPGGSGRHISSVEWK